MPDQKYSAPHALYLSFFSRSFYQDVVSNWKGFGFAYLAALLALCTIPAVLKVQADIQNQAPNYIKQLPKITIAKGSLSVSDPQPYIIKDEKTGDPFIIIDTTGTISSLEGSKAMVLLTKTAVIIKISSHESRTFKLSTMSEETISIDRSNAGDFLDSFLETFILMFYTLALLFSFLLHSAEALLYSGIGLLAARIFMIKADFKAILRVSMVSMTPALLPGALFLIAGLNLPYWWLISFTIPLGYIMHAVMTNFQKT